MKDMSELLVSFLAFIIWAFYDFYVRVPFTGVPYDVPMCCMDGAILL